MLDFSVVFDIVNYDILIKCLYEELGIVDFVLSWFELYFYNRM